MACPSSSPNLDTPPRSRTSSRSKHSSSLSLDLSDIPPLIQPDPPSNTLLVTNLNDPILFQQITLDHLRTLIQTALSNAATSETHNQSSLSQNDCLYSFSPLRSFRRIVVTFTSIPAALHIRQILDGATLGSGDRIRVFFGAHTPIDVSDKERHLQAPQASKQFFISPPPSPPAGWTSREEDPPNKDVHANDLATALGRLGKHDEQHDETAVEQAQVQQQKEEDVKSKPEPQPKRKPTIRTDVQNRSRSDSRTIVYHPEEQGHSPLLPTVAVEDTTGSPVEASPVDEEGSGGPILAHTARPPVELMQ